jgi:Type I phosphodiesterase / nucleotide pyrophosphatase
VVASLVVLLVAANLPWGQENPESVERASVAGARPPDAAAPNPRGARGRSQGATNSQDEKRPLPKAAYLSRACRLPARWTTYIRRGWNPGRERRADLILVPKAPNFVGTPANTSHSGPYPFLQRVPLVFYGPGYVRPLGRYEPGREVTVADIAPTYAKVLGFPWPRRDGAPIAEMLEDNPIAPRLIVTVSIDGGGWNVLNRWPRAWPHLATLIKRGTNVEGAVVGSSPSITPAIHTSMSTGFWPRRHGVTAIAVRSGDGEIVGAFTPSTNVIGVPVQPTLNLQATTIGDLWDLANDNRPKVGLIASGNYPLGLLGRGAALRGADRDIALFPFEPAGGWHTDPRFYSMPQNFNEAIPGPSGFVSRVDQRDGRADGRWRGHDLAGTPLSNTPAAAAWEVRAATALLHQQGFGDDRLTDLMYVHFKSPDHVGHAWNMISPEMRDVLGSVDSAIGELVRWLDAEVGEGAYLLAVTADHGQTPLGQGGWPISRRELLADIQARFDHVADDQGIIQRTSASSLFSNVHEMDANGVTPEEVSSFLSRYTIADNHSASSQLTGAFAARRNERIFDAVFPGRKLARVVACTGAGGGE